MTNTCFITASAYMGQNLFQRTEAADLLLATIVRNRDKGELLLHELVIMPNHIHLLLSVDEDHAVGRAIQLIGFSHAMGQAGLKLKAVWQHRVRDAAEYDSYAKLYPSNPVRRHLVERASDYPYSSASTQARLDEVPERLKPQSEDRRLTPA